MIEQTSATAFVSDTFWQEPTDDLYRHSAPAREGLSQIQADRRLAIFGRNRAPPSQSQSVLRKVAKRLWNSLTAMLLAGAVRGGLAVSGFASGVVSSTAAIGAMGARAREAPELLGAATAGATISTVATIAQLAATNPSTLRSLMIPLLRAGAAATFCGAISTVKGMREIGAAELQLGRAFSLSSALLLALTLSGALVSLSRSARDLWGNRPGDQRDRRRARGHAFARRRSCPRRLWKDQLHRCRRSHSGGALDKCAEQDRRRLGRALVRAAADPRPILVIAAARAGGIIPDAAY